MLGFVTAFMLVGCSFYLESIFPSIDPLFFKIFRYILMGFLLVVSYKRKKMSLWIFSAMIIGIEVGIGGGEIAVGVFSIGELGLLNLKDELQF